MNSHRLASAATAPKVATTRPARMPGVWAAAITRRMAPTKRIVRHASPKSNLLLKSMLLHAAIERATAKPEFARRERDVEMMHPQRALDHLLLKLVEVKRVARVRRAPARLGSPRQWEIVGPVAVSFGHDHRALRGMAQSPNIARPVVRNERLQHW